MINRVLMFVSFGMFLLELLFSSGILPRLLGVSYFYPAENATHRDTLLI